MTSFNYGFEQVNACGYQETYEVTNLPSFVTHNTVAKDFTVFTDNLEHVGSHTVTVVSTIQVPTDFTQATMNPISAQTEFVINVVATCDATMFVEWSLQDSSFAANVKGEEVSGSIGPVKDAVSQIKGNADGVSFCGKRLYRIIDEQTVTSFFSIDPTAETFTLSPTLDA